MEVFARLGQAREAGTSVTRETRAGGIEWISAIGEFLVVALWLGF